MANEAKLVPMESIDEVVYLKGRNGYLRSKTKKDDEKPTLTVEELKTRFLGLKGVKVRLGIAFLQYGRRLLKEGKLEGIKVLVPGGSRWLVTRESVDWYKANKRDPSTLRNYILRIDAIEEKKVRALLEEAGIEWDLEVAYKGKKKPLTPSDRTWATLIDSIE